MGELIRSHDWAATPLGPIESWPQSLRTLVNLMLDARQPAYIAWGAELTSIYNAAYIPILGSKHPGAIGKPYAELWPEIWEEYRSIVAATMAGEAQHFIDRPVPLAGRKNQPMSWFTFSWTPARDETGVFAGFYCAATETSEKVRGEAVDRERIDAEIRHNEIRYRTLVDAIDEGFYFARAIFDESGRCVDIFYQGENPAAIRMIGQSAKGRRLSDLGDYEDYWREVFGAVARTGEARRLEHFAAPDGIWYDFYVFKPPQAGPDEFAVVFRDVTERKRVEEALRRSEERQAFLLRLSDGLRPLNDPTEIIAAASEALGRHLGAGQVVYAENDCSGEYVTIASEWNDGTIPSNARRHRLEDFGPALIADLKQGQSTGIADVALDPRTSSPQVMAAFASASIKAVLDIPLLKNGRLVAILGVHSSVPRGWRAEDITVAEEVAERIWAAVERARAEAALRESEERLRGALEIDTVGVLFWGADFRLKQVNQAFLDMTGLSQEEALGLTWQELTPPEYHGSAERAVAQIEDSGRADPYEKQYLRADGSRWWGLFAPRRLADGEVVEFVLDISARRHNEQALRESEERFRLIVENARDYAIFTTDPEGLITDWHKGAESVFGWSRQEALGRPLEMTFTPEDNAEGQARKERELASRQGSAPNVRWHMRKDGSRVFIDGVATALHNEDGSVRGFLKIGQDVTERRQAQQALTASEERFRQFAEASSDTLWIANADTGELEYLSPAFESIWGEERDAVLADVARWLKLVHPDDRARAMEGMPTLLRGEPHVGEYRVMRSDGEVRTVLDSGFPIRDETGRIVRAAGVAQDITARRRAEEHQRTLLAELQHRVRNTLAVVRSIARRTAESSSDVEEMASHFQGRLDAFSRVQALVTRDPESGIDLAGIIEDELLAHAACEGEALRIEGPEVSLKPRVAESISLAIHELTTNAVKYGALSSGRGRIAVGWERVKLDGKELMRLVWEENGVEMPAHPPKRKGFGLELLQRTLPYDLRAETQVEFRPEGVRFTMTMPLGADVLAH
jgi:PAS domain S-box-containing protein